MFGQTRWMGGSKRGGGRKSAAPEGDQSSRDSPLCKDFLPTYQLKSRTNHKPVEVSEMLVGYLAASVVCVAI